APVAKALSCSASACGVASHPRRGRERYPLLSPSASSPGETPSCTRERRRATCPLLRMAWSSVDGTTQVLHVLARTEAAGGGTRWVLDAGWRVEEPTLSTGPTVHRRSSAIRRWQRRIDGVSRQFSCGATRDDATDAVVASTAQLPAPAVGGPDYD